MSLTVSPSAKKPYGVARVCEAWAIPRSTYYAHRGRAADARPPGKRGPKTPWTDVELTGHIRDVLEESPWLGEGHRKVWAYLRHVKGVRTSKARVLRLMREADLLASQRPTRVLGPRAHDGKIVTDKPDVMWGTDATSVFTTKEGSCTVFIAVDHCTSECLGIHAAKVGDRFEALEPIRQGVRRAFGCFEEGVAEGLKLRHDHGSQYISDHFQNELEFLGIESSPSFVRSPEGNGCSERFIRTLKEQLLWIRRFETVEELRLALHEWAALYNDRWLVQRHGYRTPAQVRRELTTQEQAEAA